MESKRSLQRFAESTRELWTKQGVRQAVRENLDKLTKCRTLALGAEIYASDSEIKTICPYLQITILPWLRESGDPYVAA